MHTVTRFIKADRWRLSRVFRYQSRAKVEIPINKDGSVKWYQDKPKKKG